MSASLAPKLSFQTFKTVDKTVDYASMVKKLSSFQIEKLTFFFKAFFDVNRDGIVNDSDFRSLTEKLRKIAGWEVDSKDNHAMADVISVFQECLLDQVKLEIGLNQEGLEFRTWEEALRPNKLVVESVTLNQWLNMWAKLCNGAGGIQDFPIWVQLIPQIMFAVQVGQNKDKIITKECLRHFYENFSGLKDKQLENLTEEGYSTMTSNGEYELNAETYDLLFANFLLGRTIYGPGKFIFGCFDNSDLHKKYKILPVMA
ncbi:sarcoplasmic calcium-binding proteins II, V, VI, and VII [Eurytemora carolleeae]|uniref:sarcoplasmic calcium-binding proteins II, V, VI, and VII n=1 Tax=Eurytemora carolleeae TaxID=1294199 RepID=UPI000C758B7C|nr:sarcoplasmic calcium-binding proteins II, V, VI, and VII [Eurytemora carolleeae]|eukprot:XP_023341667.1 sarcoplasmic calcium-binding proteins II, V, VI, and VII-like [Eurytemora affinis]